MLTAHLLLFRLCQPELRPDELALLEHSGPLGGLGQEPLGGALEDALDGELGGALDDDMDVLNEDTFGDIGELGTCVPPCGLGRVPECRPMRVGEVSAHD